MTVRTRFAPSPTGFLHLGGARTALFSWAYARHFGGEFILRIEDTDVERSTPEAVQAIMDGMEWLGLDFDEGPFFQMQHMDRYREVIAEMLASGTAYYCYSSTEELDAMRDGQRERGEPIRYDGTWRPEEGKELPPVPAGREPVVRFKNPVDGAVSWDDMVLGNISISNTELDDLVIARSDGTPTYNFCVVVDDWDMRITHVIRGNDHVNNTPRQINILKALGAPLPLYAHVPMILGDDGEKLSKRHGAVSVMDYPEEGYLPDAMVNYLARLGWSHGNDEIFSRQQFTGWFDMEHMSRSAAQFDPDKLKWLNNHYIRQTDNQELAALVRPRLESLGVATGDTPDLSEVVALLKDRAQTLNELAQESLLFYRYVQPDDAVLQAHMTAQSLEALTDFAKRCEFIEWDMNLIASMTREVIKEHGLKMPQLAMPLRLILTGQSQTPSVDAVVSLLGRDTVLSRIKPFLKNG